MLVGLDSSPRRWEVDRYGSLGPVNGSFVSQILNHNTSSIISSQYTAICHIWIRQSLWLPSILILEPMTVPTMICIIEFAIGLSERTTDGIDYVHI